MRSIFSLYAPVDEVAVNESYIDAVSDDRCLYINEVTKLNKISINVGIGSPAWIWFRALY